ncbi:hypothetical protein BZG36_05530 [Bifiguratus adelaidae]|uniref:Uncharacterized protein n=1 Tax=Bifiguratus adelaidae TaxID=1938954 RepID=A0A261XTD9_9FUNG|nr:hypothetical protein BZG36_05530 [Bifiguratus adelaidae]
MDVSDASSIKVAAVEVDKICPEGIEVLIDNAAALLSHDFDVDSESTKTVNTNVIIVLEATKAFLPALQKRQRCLVVIVSSIAGSNTIIGQMKLYLAPASYLVSKVALNM